MEILRQVNDYSLNKGDGMARGLYNVNDKAEDTSSEATAIMRVSNWIDEEEKNILLKLNKKEFKEECEKLLKLN